MPAFRFRLASVLRYREHLREERRWELRALAEERECLTSEIRKLEQLLTRQTQEMEEQREKILSVVDLRLQGDFAQRVLQSIREKHSLLAVMQKKLEEKRDEVVQANREVKSLEQLRSRFWERHYWQEGRDEQKLIDEAGQRRCLNRTKV